MAPRRTAALPGSSGIALVHRVRAALSRTTSTIGDRVRSDAALAGARRSRPGTAQAGRQPRRYSIGSPSGLGAAARNSRSRIASPRPCAGMGMTAIARCSGRSSARSMANRLAAASSRSSGVAEVQRHGRALERVRPEGEQGLVRGHGGDVETERARGRVVAGELARRAQPLRLRRHLGTGQRAHHPLQLLAGDPAGPQQARRRAREVEHRRIRRRSGRGRRRRSGRSWRPGPLRRGRRWSG